MSYSGTYDKIPKGYFGEALECYKAGAYKMAIVAATTAVHFEIDRKIASTAKPKQNKPKSKKAAPKFNQIISMTKEMPEYEYLQEDMIWLKNSRDMILHPNMWIDNTREFLLNKETLKISDVITKDLTLYKKLIKAILINQKKELQELSEYSIKKAITIMRKSCHMESYRLEENIKKSKNYKRYDDLVKYYFDDAEICFSVKCYMMSMVSTMTAIHVGGYRVLLSKKILKISDRIPEFDSILNLFKIKNIHKNLHCDMEEINNLRNSILHPNNWFVNVKFDNNSLTIMEYLNSISLKNISPTKKRIHIAIIKNDINELKLLAETAKIKTRMILQEFGSNKMNTVGKKDDETIIIISKMIGIGEAHIKKVIQELDSKPYNMYIF